MLTMYSVAENFMHRSIKKYVAHIFLFKNTDNAQYLMTAQ